MIVPDKIFIVGNWKMKPGTLKEATTLARSLIGSSKRKVEVVICPPHPFLETVKQTLPNNLVLGAQDMYWEDIGSFTGEVSAPQLKSLEVRYVILGHSSRRAGGEQNNTIHKKITAALRNDIIPIVCIGEQTRDKKGLFWKELETQIKETFKDFEKTDLEHMLIAYEPVWAIGKNAKRAATPEEIKETNIFIKKTLNDMTGNIPIGRINIMYGGSINDPGEALQYLTTADSQGLLIGRASLDSEQFNTLITTIEHHI